MVRMSYHYSDWKDIECIPFEDKPINLLAGPVEIIGIELIAPEMLYIIELGIKNIIYDVAYLHPKDKNLPLTHYLADALHVGAPSSMVYTKIQVDQKAKIRIRLIYTIKEKNK
jgi:hypothetical protein